MPIEIVDAPSESQFHALVDGKPAGRVEYILTGDGVIVFTHTEVDPAFDGHGVGGALARGVLEEARARGLRVLPQCPFIKAWIGRHPEFEDLVYPGA